jgi:hypothetical protein
MYDPRTDPEQSNGVFDFTKQGKLLDGRASVGIEVCVPSAPAVAAALAGNTAFPAGTVRLGAMSSRAKGGTGTIRFHGSRAGGVSFRGETGMGGGLAVYSTAGELRNDLDQDGKALDGIDLPEDGVSRFVALNWAYDIRGAAKGSLALGAGSSVRFSADGQRDGFFAVIRGFAEDPPARDAVQSLLDNWMLPGQVTTPEQLAPGTWLVAEVDGEFALELAARFGYKYSWLRKVGLAGLSGDIGLRIQAAADATIGLGASGKYILVVARESLDPNDRIVRVTLSKTARSGWKFALNAGIGVTGRTARVRPGELDDLAAALLGIHGAQIVKQLRLFRGWTDLSIPLPELLAGFAVAYAKNQLSGYAGEDARRLAEARARIQDFLDRWSELTDQVCSLLWSELRTKDGRADAEFATTLSSLAGATEPQVQHVIEEHLRDPAFLDTTAGRWLESVVAQDLMTALADREKAGVVARAAASTLAILDGKVLEELIRYVNGKLHLDRVREMVDRASIEGLDPWLKERLSGFLGESLSLEGLEHVRKTLAFLDREAQGLFDSTLAALNETYSISFGAAYSCAGTKTALLDICLDFSQGADLADLLARVIDGDWRAVLLTSQDGVTLRKAVLTHGIRRQSHVEINLPFFTGAAERVANTLSSMTVVEDGGRLFVYEIGARDEVKARHRWRSSLAISGKVVAGAGDSVRVFTSPAQLDDLMACSYAFRMAFPGMRALQLRQHLNPLASYCFPRTFGDDPSGVGTTLAAWVADLERHAAQAGAGSPGYLGNTLLSLRIGLPGRVVAAWQESPESELDIRYMEMSRALQRALRRIIPLCYFQDPHRLVAAESDIAAQVLVYQALPVSTSISASGGELRLDTEESLFWDYRDPAERRAMIFNDATATALSLRMAQVRDLLLEIDSLRNYAEDYGPGNLERLRETAFDPTGSDLMTRSLLFAEASAVRHACDAGRAMARFRKSAGADPAEALEAMARFGEQTAGTFHSGLSDLFRGQGPNIRELGSLLLTEAACALDPGLKAEPTAQLEVTILRRAAPESWADEYLSGRRPAPATIAVRQSIVEKPAGPVSRKAS